MHEEGGNSKSLMVLAGFLSIDITVKPLRDNICVNKSGGGVKGSHISRRKWGKMAGRNHKKLNILGNGGKIMVVITWSSFLSRVNLAKAPSDHSFFNKSRGGGQ